LAVSALRTLRSLRSSLTLGALRARFSGQPAVAGGTLRSLRTLRTLRSGLTLGALRSRLSGQPAVAFGALRTLRALRTLQSLRTLRALRTGGTLRAFRADLAAEIPFDRLLPVRAPFGRHRPDLAVDERHAKAARLARRSACRRNEHQAPERH